MADEFINVDLDEVEDNREPMPEGTPGVRIKSAEMKHKEGSEFPYIAIEMKPAPGQVDEKYANKSLFLNLSFHPKALWNMKAFLSKLGIGNIKGKRPSELCRELIDRTIRPTVKVTEGQDGSPRNEVGPPYHVFNG